MSHTTLTRPCRSLQIHWFSIFNSFMMVIFLTGLVSMILLRTLRNDYAKCVAHMPVSRFPLHMLCWRCPYRDIKCRIYELAEHRDELQTCLAP